MVLAEITQTEWFRLRDENRALKEELARRHREITALHQHQLLFARTYIASQQQLQSLVALAQNLPLSTETPSLLEQALDKVMEILEVPGAALFLLQGEKLTLTTHRGFTSEMVAEVERMGLERFIGRESQRGKLPFAEDFSPEGKTEYRSYASVPVRWGQMPGVLVISDRLPRALGEREQVLLQAIADVVSSALEHSALDRTLQKKLDRLDTITKLTSILNSSLDVKGVYDGFARQLQQLVPADRVSLSLIEGDTVKVLTLYEDSPRGLPTTLQREDTAFPWVIEHRHPLYLPDVSLDKEKSTFANLLLEKGLRCFLLLPLLHLGDVFGILTLGSRQPHAFGERERELLSELSGQVSQAVVNYVLYQELKERNQKLERAWLEVGLAWVRAGEARHPLMKGHSERVSHYAKRICHKLGLSEAQTKTIELGARLHDLGMLAMPHSIALKEGELTLEEWAQVDLHPALGAELLAPLPQFHEVLPLIHCHHEWYNGQGYPHRLQGEEIPLGARILAVADAYDAITTPRPYRPASSPEKARQALETGAGSQFDPQVVEAFLKATLEEL